MEHAKLRTVGLVVLALVAGVALAGCMDDGEQETTDPGTDDGETSDDPPSDDPSGDGSDAGSKADSGDDPLPQTELDTPDSWPMVGFNAAHTGAYGGPGDGDPEEAWTLPAPDNAAPSAGNGFVYLPGPAEDDARPTFRALVPETGDEAWRFHAEVAQGSTVDADHVYILDETGQSYTPTALDTGTGEVAWTLQEDGFEGSIAPAILGERVFFMAQSADPSQENGTLFALDTSTGDVDWKTQAPVAGQLMTSGDQLLLGGGGFQADGELHVFDPDTGDHVSSLDTQTRTTHHTVANGTLFTASARGIAAWDLASGENRWKQGVDEMVDGPPTIHEGTVYVGGTGHDGPAKVHALDAQTGEEAWAFELDGAWVNPSPAIAHGTVYVASQADNGNEYGFYAIDADEGTEVWSLSIAAERTDGGAPTSVMFVDGMLFADVGAHWFALDV